jgi:glutamyl-tRNA reductase
MSYEQMTEMMRVNEWLETRLTQETISSINSDHESVRYLFLQRVHRNLRNRTYN